jgi:hypothetical protein
MFDFDSKTGFAPPKSRPLGQERGIAMMAQLIATVTLAVSTLAIAAVVSIGAAHAWG